VKRWGAGLLVALAVALSVIGNAIAQSGAGRSWLGYLAAAVIGAVISAVLVAAFQSLRERPTLRKYSAPATARRVPVKASGSRSSDNGLLDRILELASGRLAALVAGIWWLFWCALAVVVASLLSWLTTFGLDVGSPMFAISQLILSLAAVGAAWIPALGASGCVVLLLLVRDPDDWNPSVFEFIVWAILRVLLVVSVGVAVIYVTQFLIGAWPTA
jgi:hypothetical protein